MNHQRNIRNWALSGMSSLAMALAGSAAAQVIDFEDALLNLGAGQHVTNDDLGHFYADEGLTISSPDNMWIGNGLAAGDHGDFDIDGTNGPAFISLYLGNPGDKVVFTFNRRVHFDLDMIASANGDGLDVRVVTTTYRNGLIVHQQFHLINNPVGDPDGQPRLIGFADIDAVEFRLEHDSDRVLAFDNLRITTVSCGPADINQDGVLDFFDVSAYIQQFTGGCP